MNSKISFVVFFILISVELTAQKNFAKAERFLEDNIGELGGRAVLMIYKEGKIIYSHAVNNISPRQKRIAKFISKRRNADMTERLEDFTVSSRQRIASSSKWLSAAMVMTFVDEGKLSLEDTIGKFLPVMTLTGKGHIKIWQCLSHLTGIRSAGLRESLQEMKDIKSMDEAMEKIAALPMEGEPGKTFHYGNTGLQIAGAVMEKIGGKSFEKLFADRIAKPCEMKNTDFSKGPVALPAGGAYSTAEDYMNFLAMILQEGKFRGKQVLSKSSVKKMQQNYTRDATIIYTPAEAGSWGYGFGEWVMEEAGERSQAVTSPGLFGSFPWVDNEKKYAGFLFCFNLKNKGRGERYRELKKIIDDEFR